MYDFVIIMYSIFVYILNNVLIYNNKVTAHTKGWKNHNFFSEVQDLRWGGGEIMF